MGPAERNDLLLRATRGMRAATDLDPDEAIAVHATELGSEKPEAKAFRKWVTGTVLPTMRWDVTLQHCLARAACPGQAS